MFVFYFFYFQCFWEEKHYRVVVVGGVIFLWIQHFLQICLNNNTLFVEYCLKSFFFNQDVFN